MGGFYSLSRSNTALPASTNDFLTILGASARTLRLAEASIGGMGTASAANELQVARSSAGTTPSGGVTAAPMRVNQVAAGFTNATAWVAQPTLGNVLVRLPINANGAIYRWVRPQWMDAEWISTDQISYRPATGTSLVSFHTLVEEF